MKMNTAKIRITFSVLTVLLLFAQCKMQSISVNITYPPDVILPENIKRMAVINASITDTSEKAVNQVEGILSGEAYAGDRLASEDCIRAFSDKMNAAKFETVIPKNHSQTKKPTQGIPFMDRNVINKICREYRSDAIAVLEFFDTNTDVVAKNIGTVNNILQGSLNPVPVNYQINYQWRLYDTLNNTVIDDYRDAFKAVFNPSVSNHCQQN